MSFHCSESPNCSLTSYVHHIITFQNKIYPQHPFFTLLGPELMTSTDQLSVYVRHWHPSTITLDPPKEVVLQDSVVDELKAAVSWD